MKWISKHLLPLLLCVPLLGGWSTVACSDYILQTYALDRPTEGGKSYAIVASEFFIARSDCNKRGSKNVALMRSLEERGGWTCTYILGSRGGT